MNGTDASLTELIPRFAASNLESVLDEQGRKRRWLAERVGVSESLISKLLAGKLTISQDLGERISAVVGVPFFVLFELHQRDVCCPSVGHNNRPKSGADKNGHSDD